MRRFNLKLMKSYPAAFDNALTEIFKILLETNPKPKSVSQPVYLTLLAIQLLERLGNKFPSQEEIDNTELILGDYRKRKAFKNIYKLACGERNPKKKKEH